MSSSARKPLKFPPRSSKAKLDPRERCHAEFLAHIAAGRSIGDACSLTGVTRSNYENWRARVPGFKARVEAAREQHRREIASGLHTAEAYSRMLMDAIQRDEALPATLRYRAAKSILNRPGKKDWLPEPLPAGAPALNTDFEEPAPPQQDNPEQQTKPAATAAAPADPLNPLTEIASSEAAEPLPIRALSNTQAALPSATQFSRDPRPHTAEIPPPETAHAAAAAANHIPVPSQPERHPTLKFLSPYFLHKHEAPQAFESLLARYLAAYNPATPAEEHTVLRIAKQSWHLRRNEALERVIADSTVTQIRAQHPEAAAPAALALGILEARPTAYARFHERIVNQRRQIEAAQARLEASLLALQRHRESGEQQTQARLRPSIDTTRASKLLARYAA